MATMFMPNVHSRSVYFNSTAKMASTSASFLQVITARMPVRSDSSTMSVMSARTSFFASFNNIILRRSSALLVW